MATHKSRSLPADDRKKLPTPSDFKFVGFANVELEEKDFELIDKLLDDSRVEMVGLLSAVCDDFLKFSLVQLHEEGGWRAQLTAFGGTNVGMILTAEGPGLSEAVVALLVKHDKVGKEWPLRSAREGGKYR